MAEKKEKQYVSDNAQSIYSKIRGKVISIIEQYKTNEVTSNSNFNEAGIYMLYVDSFDDDTIIPFYIGQTSNFQERHKKHLSEIMALNRLNRDCYKYALFAELYNGHNRPCKIFSYMVNHGCLLKDLHMIVLEVIDDEKTRLEIEQKYIDELYAPFFGFNQLNSVLRSIEYHYGESDKKDYSLAKEKDKDIEEILRFATFGYALYNWYRSCDAFLKTISAKQQMDKFPDLFLRIHNSKKRLEEIRLRLSEIKGYNSLRAEDDVWSICKKTIDAYFSQRNLKSAEKKKLVVKVWLFDIESDRNELEKYFAKYFDRIDENIFELIERIHGKKIYPIKQKVADNQCEYRALEEEKDTLNNVVLGTLLPKHYVSHPLGDMEKHASFDVSDNRENICYLNIEFTCFRSDYINDCYPDITRVDYYVVNNGQVKTRSIYIENSLTDFFDHEDLYYCESGFRYGPFNPYLRGNIDTHIPVTMEYKNGINEWSLRGKETGDFRKVFKEINMLIDEKTNVVYSTSGYKSTILRFINCEELSGTTLAKKLKRLCK